MLFRRSLEKQDVEEDEEYVHNCKRRRLRQQSQWSMKGEVMRPEKKVRNLHIVRKKGVFTISSSEKKKRKKRRKNHNER